MKKEIREVDEKRGVCGHTFTRPKCYSDIQWEGRKFCSPECARKTFSSIRLIQWEDPAYHKMMSEVHKGQKPWNKGRKLPEFSGHNHPRYTGTAPLKKAIRNMFEYRQWRSDVLTRDNHTCTDCGDKKKLEVDHFPKKFIEIIEEYGIVSIEMAIDCSELWNINNGRTLCSRCHYKTKLKSSAKDN